MTTPSQGSAGRQSALYTPEAVRVDLPLADIGSRSLALLIDFMLMGSILYFVLIISLLGAGLDSSGEGPGWVAIVFILLLNFLVLWGYPVGSETLFRGRTAGKAAVGLRVVTVEGAPVRFRHAAIRGLLAFIDFYLFFGIPAIVTTLVTRKAQRLGDLAAGTVTIRDRASRGSGNQAIRWQIPPVLTQYARTLDVRGMNTADYAVVRRFLLRAGSLEPDQRLRIATDLGNHIADRMNHRPPPGTHPEALLLCVAALVQQQGDVPRPGAPPQAPPQNPPPAPTPPPVAQPSGWGPPGTSEPPTPEGDRHNGDSAPGPFAPPS